MTGGLIWHVGDGSSGNEALRHECSEGDGLGPYGWVEHDGKSYGRQDIEDRKAGVRLVTSMVKPAQLGQHGGSLASDGEAADGGYVGRWQGLEKYAWSSLRFLESLTVFQLVSLSRVVKLLKSVCLKCGRAERYRLP